MNNSAKEPFVTPELSVDELSKALFEVSQSLQKTNDKLIQTKKQQSEFFSNISHDLRSPIAALRSSVEYLLTYDSLNSDECLQIYSVMKKKIDYMEQMINDIFLLSTLDSQERKLKLEVVPIDMFLEEFFVSCEQDPYYCNCTLNLDLPCTFPYQVQIDTNLLIRVLNNLFTNAIKYSQETTYIKLSATTYKDNTILVTVEDHGIGIAKEHLEKIFEQSNMVSDARTPCSSTGNGLGLAIAKSIIELHGGSIWCESEKGKGSKFLFTLPIINR